MTKHDKQMTDKIEMAKKMTKQWQTKWQTKLKWQKNDKKWNDKMTDKIEMTKTMTKKWQTKWQTKLKWQKKWQQKRQKNDKINIWTIPGYGCEFLLSLHPHLHCRDRQCLSWDLKCSCAWKMPDPRRWTSVLKHHRTSIFHSIFHVYTWDVLIYTTYKSWILCINIDHTNTKTLYMNTYLAIISAGVPLCIGQLRVKASKQ